MIRVLLSERMLDEYGARLAEMPVEPVLIDGEIDAVEVIWASSDIYLSRTLTRRCFGVARSSDTLRWLHTASAGVDAPIFAELLDRGVLLTSSHVTGPPIAEYVMRAVLDWFQRAADWRAAAAERRWAKHEFREVLGTTWLIVGLGSIGREVAVRARAFGAEVIGVRRTPTGDETVDVVVAADRFLEVVPLADVLVLAAPASAATHHLVDGTCLGLMRPRSVLVNVARGSLVDEAALLRALDAGVPEAALLDVAATEPPPDDSPLWSHPRVVLTPHSSALGSGQPARSAEVFLENLAHYVAGREMPDLVRRSG